MRDFQQLIKVAGEQSNTAMTAARALGLKITEAQAKGESTADLRVTFEKAKTDAVAAIQAVNDLRAEEKLELQAAESQRAQEEHDREMSSLRGARPARAIDTGSHPADTQQASPGAHAPSDRSARGIERMARRLEKRASRMTPQQRQGTSEALRGYIKGDLEGMRLAIGAYAEREHITPDELHALMTGNETLGGALVRDDQLAEVIRDLPGIAVFAKYARVQPTSRDALSFPSIAAKSAGETSYPSGFTGSFKKSPSKTGGAAPNVQQQPTFQRNRVPVHDWRPDAIEIELNLLEDADADVEGMLNEIIGQTMAQDMDDKCTLGTGNTEPLGLLTEHADFALPTVHSGHASQLTYAGLTNLFAGLPAQYRQGAVWMMNTAGAFAAILQLQDSNGRPILEPNMLPGTLWGKPIAFNERMANPAANAYPIVFGDFRYYIIAMRAQLRVQRLLERFTPNIGLQPWSRFGGQTLRPNAFRRQKCAA